MSDVLTLPTTSTTAAVRAVVEELNLPRGLPGPSWLRRLTDRLAANVQLWRPHVHHDSKRRWYAQFHVEEAFEVWLLGWDVGQKTELHDHGGSSGAFTVCEGELTELHTTHDRLGRLRRGLISSGGSRPFGPAYVHDLGNAGPGRATSIHAYAPPLVSMTFFEHVKGALQPASVLPVGGPDPGVHGRRPALVGLP